MSENLFQCGDCSEVFSVSQFGQDELDKTVCCCPFCASTDVSELEEDSDIGEEAE